jgi:predicted Na+-dependent transporter
MRGAGVKTAQIVSRFLLKIDLDQITPVFLPCRELTVGLPAAIMFKSGFGLNSQPLCLNWRLWRRVL